MENEKKKLDGGKIITTIIITVSTAIVFLALGYWAGTLQSEEAETATDTTALSSATTTASSVASTSASATASTTSTADWKTYTNSEYGFSFKYPSTFAVTDTLAPDSSKDVDSKLILKNTKDSLEIWINPDGFGPFFPDYEYQITASTSGLNIGTKDNGGSDEKSDGVTFATGQFTYANTQYLLHYKIKGGDSESLAQFDQILSTFQFTSK